MLQYSTIHTLVSSSRAQRPLCVTLPIKRDMAELGPGTVHLGCADGQSCSRQKNRKIVVTCGGRVEQNVLAWG